jgi:chloramphenicol 3-O-phosphotransferase
MGWTDRVAVPRMARLRRGLCVLGRVHPGVAYDLEIDTAATMPEEKARTIRDAFGL